MTAELIPNSHDHSVALMLVSRLLNSTLDLDQLLELVMDIAIEALDAERGFLMLMRPETTDLSFTVARNIDRQTLSESEFEISRSVVMQVSKDGEPLLTDNASMDPRFQAHKSIVAYKLRSILCVPLTVKEEVTGVIYLDNRIRAGTFEEKDRDFLVSFAHMAAVAIENARLFQRVQSNLAETNRLKVLMDNVFASVASGVITVGTDGGITMMNRAALQMMRRSADEMVGRRLEDALPWLVAHPMPDMLAQVIGGQKDVATLSLSHDHPGPGRNHLSRHHVPLEWGIRRQRRDRSGRSHARSGTAKSTRTRRASQESPAKAMLQRYLSPTIAGQLANSPDSLALGGERQEITILFADSAWLHHPGRTHAPRRPGQDTQPLSGAGRA